MKVLATGIGLVAGFAWAQVALTVSGSYLAAGLIVFACTLAGAAVGEGL